MTERDGAWGQDALTGAIRVVAVDAVGAEVGVGGTELAVGDGAVQETHSATGEVSRVADRTIVGLSAGETGGHIAVGRTGGQGVDEIASFADIADVSEGEAGQTVHVQAHQDAHPGGVESVARVAGVADLAIGGADVAVQVVALDAHVEGGAVEEGVGAGGAGGGVELAVVAGQHLAHLALLCGGDSVA